jgi:uncharacterized membrane protein HdeD (DUF308 family)
VKRAPEQKKLKPDRGSAAPAMLREAENSKEKDTMSASTDRVPGLGYTNVAHKWGWFVALGILLLVVGVLALLGDLILLTLISTIFFGALLVVGGVMYFIHAFNTKEWSGFLYNVVCGVVYVIGGVLIMREPVQGALVLTIFITAALIVGGVMRMIVSFRHRELAGWWLMALGGLISIVLGIWLLMSLPWSSLWVLGTLIAVELIVQGASWLGLGLSLRRLAR